MNTLFARCAGLALIGALAACAGPSGQHLTSSAADGAFDRLVALQGDWVDADGATGGPGQVVSNWRVTGGGSAVVETLFPGGPEEMVTVYHRDGGDLVLTHYCAVGNQPHMRATADTGDALQFEFVGGTNLDAARDMHMHSVRFEFASPDELREHWQGWIDGHVAPEHVANIHLVRKKA